MYVLCCFVLYLDTYVSLSIVTYVTKYSMTVNSRLALGVSDILFPSFFLLFISIHIQIHKKIDRRKRKEKKKMK